MEVFLRGNGPLGMDVLEPINMFNFIRVNQESLTITFSKVSRDIRSTW